MARAQIPLGSFGGFWLAHATRMKRLCALLSLVLVLSAFSVIDTWGGEQPQPESDALVITSLHHGEQGYAEYHMDTGIATVTNGVMIQYRDAVLTAERWASWNTSTKEVEADGDVRIQQGDQVWVGEHIRYNFATHQMQAEQFRTGETPVFAAGRGLHGDVTNRV